MSGILAYLMQRGNAAKRNVRGLLADPVGVLGQWGEQTAEDMAAPFQMQPGPEKVNRMVGGVLGMAPLGITGKAYYHGTGGQDFGAKFDTAFAKRNAFGKGIHLSESPDLANYYAMQWKDGQRVIPVRLPENVKLADKAVYDKISFDVRAAMEDGNIGNGAADAYQFWSDEIVRRLKAEGYDGVRYTHEPIFQNIGGRLKQSEKPMNSVVIFDPAKISSAIE